MAAKKKRGKITNPSAKQKAAWKKAGARLKKMNKAKGAKPRKSPKRKAAKRKAAPKRKVNKKKVAPKRQMAGKKGVLSKVTSNPTLKKILMAAGAVSVATSIAVIAAPSLVPTIQKPIVKAVLGFVAGDFIGAASNFVIGGGINSLKGGNGATQSSSMVGSNGFA